MSDQALVVWGRPTTVYAELDRRRAGVHVDDDAFVSLRWDDGRHAHLWASAVAAQPGPRFRVLGSRSGYVKWGMDPQEDALRAGRSPTEPGWGAEGPEHRAESIDLSGRGVLLETPLNLQVGSTVEFRLKLPEEITGQPTTEWRCRGCVVR